MTTLLAVELGVLGPLQVRQAGRPVAIPGAKPRAILTMLGLHEGSVVSADTLVELLWSDDPPRTAAKALQTHISALRRTLGDGVVMTLGAGWALAEADVDASRYKIAARLGRDAAAAGDISQAVARFEEALMLWRGIPELPDGQRGASEKTRWIETHSALVEDRADALLVSGRAAEIIGELEAAVADAPLRERRWGQLMLALYRAGRQGEALGAYQRARSLLADQLGVDPGPELRRLEAAIVAQDAALDMPVAQQASSITRAVTFLLTDIEGSTAAWEADSDAMAVALARHDELVEQVVTSRGGRLIKTRGEGDATFSVFERPSAAAAAAIELQDAIGHEPWELQAPLRIRVALHTGEVELRDGDYFGRAVNRAARLRSLASGDQILCSGATAELVIDSLPDDVVLADLGMRQLRNLARPEHVFELRMEGLDDRPQDVTVDEPVTRPDLPTVLTNPGPFVGRGRELARLLSAWQAALGGGMSAMLIAGEPGVGKTRLAAEWSLQAYEQGAFVLYGRCDEDLGAPYQPFAEALRSLVPCLGESRLRGLRGLEALLPLVPGLTDVLPDLSAPTRSDPDTERYALFDAVVAVLELASASAPVVLIIDDLHWAAKSTLLLLRHLLRFGERARVQVVGTYRSTDLDRSHPLAAMLADLHRDGTAERLQLNGLDEDDVTAYVAEVGYDDEELARALASVTGGNPFFLIEALRHVDESGGVWDQSTLPQGVREAVSRRLSRLPAETNKALAAAAVVGSRFAVELVERVVDQDLVDAFDEACKAGIVIEEPGGRYRFNHALIRQSLLAELPSVRRMRLHQRIAATLESEPGTDDELLADLAHHYFECAWAGNAAKAVEYCRRAADQAMARLAYEGAADLYDHALHALEELDDELLDRDDQTAELLVARCEALFAAGDMPSATDAVAQLQSATSDSPRLAAWADCFDGQLSMLTHPERLDVIESSVDAAAATLAELDDAAGEAKAHTVRAGCLARLGRIGDAEIALDHALTAARRAREHRRVNSVLANAPLAALWGPNPVPRAGGRCLDVVRLLRITTDSPAVEATSTRCQAVLEAFRGRAAAARRMIDSARRTVTDLGLRHALLEVEQFAGIVELVIDDPAAAEPHLRKAYNGFRRLRLDADTAETAALLGRACLALDRSDEAEELCAESERLAGHALKASIAWRTLRAHLLSRRGEHVEARGVAEAAVSLAERTDLLVDHADACLSLAMVLSAAGEASGARAAAERAAELYERKGAAALAEKARDVLGQRSVSSASAVPGTPKAEPENECVRVLRKLYVAAGREDWDELERLVAPVISVESRRRVVGFQRIDFQSKNYINEVRRARSIGPMQHRQVCIAVRGERLALTRVQLSTADHSAGAPSDEVLQLFTLDESGRITHELWFDVDDMDAAMAELDALHRQFEASRAQAQTLENTASRVVDRYLAHFAARKWDLMVDTVADDFFGDDRRPVVNSGVRRGRDEEIANLQAIAEVGCRSITSTPIATRGERLVLARHSFTLDDWPDSFHNRMIDVVEIDADNRLVAQIAFDTDDLAAALEELDARYLAGEAAPYARTWSVITRGFAALNKRDLNEIPATTDDYQIIDHRLHSAVAAADLTALFHATWELTPQLHIYIEAVHRLDDLGTVITQGADGTSEDGFDAQWRMVQLLTVEGLKGHHCELFDEAALEAALARFDELHPQVRRLENAASRWMQTYLPHFAARDWKAMGEMLAEDICTDDRRRTVNAGIVHGRDIEIANLRAIADIGVEKISSTTIATRGERLLLHRTSFLIPKWREELNHGVIEVVELTPDYRGAAHVVFDPDDVDAAFGELEARYLAGEAAPYAHVWQHAVDTLGEVNRHEPGRMVDGIDYSDHRRVPFAPGDFRRAAEQLWTLVPDAKYRVTTVHALDATATVASLLIEGTDAHGNELQWARCLLFVADPLSMDIYEEDDVDTALARFQELHRQERRLENAASRTYERASQYFAARDWTAMAEALAPGVCDDDRRRGANHGVQHGREFVLANSQTAANLGATHISVDVVATRGDRLALCRVCHFGDNQGAQPFHMESLGVVEIGTDDRVLAHVAFSLDDIDAAFTELDARYLAGEAAPHARVWSVIAKAYAGFNRGELPASTEDWVNVDNRRAAAMAPGEGTAYFRASWELAANLNVRIEAVHRLSDSGAIFTHVGKGSSRDGFEAEWRTVDIMMVDGDLVSRGELFDEADLEAALARFEELHQQIGQFDSRASRAAERFVELFAARDWEAMAELFAVDYYCDDRRRVVNAGVRRGRAAAIEDLQLAADVGLFTRVSVSILASRGEHLIVTQFRAAGREAASIQFGVLQVMEFDANYQVAATAILDPEDLDAAFAELDARYLAGEAAPYARTWSVIANAYAGFNRGEPRPTTSDWVNVDHRRIPRDKLAKDDLPGYLRAAWDSAPNLAVHIETVHKLDRFGAVVTHVARGTSQDGFDAEWRWVEVLCVQGDRISRCEIFDEADLEAALARFDELSQPARLENAATQTRRRLADAFNRRDLDGVLAVHDEGARYEDRRRGLRNEGPVDQKLTHGLLFDAPESWRLEIVPVAIRGSRLALTRDQFHDTEDTGRPITVELLSVTEVSEDGLTYRALHLDPDDIDTAFAELDARYLAGEAAAHSQMWSVIAQGYAAHNRREAPATSDWTAIDHRVRETFHATDLTAYIRSAWELTPDVKIFVEAVHRLSDSEALFTHVAYGTTEECFEAEWRMVALVTMEADGQNRCELFDEAEFDSALARYDEIIRSRQIRGE